MLKLYYLCWFLQLPCHYKHHNQCILWNNFTFFNETPKVFIHYTHLPLLFNNLLIILLLSYSEPNLFLLYIILIMALEHFVFFWNYNNHRLLMLYKNLICNKAPNHHFLSTLLQYTRIANSIFIEYLSILCYRTLWYYQNHIKFDILKDALS